MYINELNVRKNDDGITELVSPFKSAEKKSFWVAQITGKDEKFGLKRNFLKLTHDAQGYLKADLKEGLYEFYCKSLLTGIPIRGFVKVDSWSFSFGTSAGELDSQYKQEAKKEE